MSLNDFCVDHLSESKVNLQTSTLTSDPSHGDNSVACTSTPHRRRRQTNQALEALGQLIKDSLGEELDEKLNKNDILGLTISRLLRRKYNPTNLVNLTIPLTEGLTSNTLEEQINGFLFVVNPQGRIIFISDNAECYLRKNVRALYSQLTSIYQCISPDQHEAFRQILARQTGDEQQMICAWHLPRGKRPSRTHSESRAMLISGHYIYLHNDKRKDQQEPLFVAHCEQILSSTPNLPSNNRGVTSATTLRLVLNEQFQINEISSNAQPILGYHVEELMDQSIKRFLPSEQWTLLDVARDNCCVGQHCTTMNVVDLYAADGSRLTFLCNVHTLIENRRKAMKFGFIAQLIDPSMRDVYVDYANQQNLERIKTTTQQDSLLLSNIYGTEPVMNVEQSLPIAPSDRYLDLNALRTVCPATVIPHRRKRRRISRPIKKEEMSPYSEAKLEEMPTNNNDFNSSLSSVSDNSTSSASPMQEIGAMDGLLPFYEEIFPQEKLKLFPDFSHIDDWSDFFGFNPNQASALFLSPTLATYSFFA